MRVLVTGAGGFVGRLLVAEQRAAGHTVVAAGHGTERSVDFRIPEHVSELVETFQPEVVHHLAGTSTLVEMLRDPHGGNYNVVQPAVNVLESLATHCPGARMIVVSPCEVYGRAGRLPTDESAPLAPVDVYAAARAAVEFMARSYAARGVHVIVARAFHFTGPGQATIWPLAEAAAHLARGEPIRVPNLEIRRDVSDVRDIVSGVGVLAAHGAPGEAYNLCSGTARSMRGLLELLAPGARVEEDPSLRRAGEVPVFLGSPAKAEALGWARRFSVETTLADLRASLG